MHDQEHDQEQGASVRVALFHDRPDCLLFYFPDRVAVHLPPLRAPFSETEVRSVLRNARVDARVSITAAGRWTRPLLQLVHAERAERRQRAILAAATAAGIGIGSSVGTERDKAAVIAKKIKVDAEIGQLKIRIGKAKSTAYETGRYMDPHAYRQLETRLEAAKSESQALQGRLTEIRKQSHQAGTQRNQTWLERFQTAARGYLDDDAYQMLCELASEDEEEEEGSDA